MTTSSSIPTMDRGLDAMIIVFSLLKRHPAATPCEQFIKGHAGWFTSVLALFEAKAILSKVYGVDPTLATAMGSQFAQGPIIVCDVDLSLASAAFQFSDSHGLDLSDAVLLQLARQYGAQTLTTDDQALAKVSGQYGIVVDSPFDPGLRQQTAAWEAANLTPKGLPRILRRVHEWLLQGHPLAAADFWSVSGNGSHLP